MSTRAPPTHSGRMPRDSRREYAAVACALACLIASMLVLFTPPAQAATPITVAQAISTQNGTTATVRGYVVGQPTATNTVVTSNYPNDYALALADSPGETSTSRMVYVQITSSFRATYGLRTNPSLKGQQLDVTGLAPGLMTARAFWLAYCVR